MTIYTTEGSETENARELGGMVSRISIWPVTSAVRDELAIPNRPVRGATVTIFRLMLDPSKTDEVDIVLISLTTLLRV